MSARDKVKLEVAQLVFAAMFTREHRPDDDTEPGPEDIPYNLHQALKAAEEFCHFWFDAEGASASCVVSAHTYRAGDEFCAACDGDGCMLYESARDGDLGAEAQRACGRFRDEQARLDYNARTQKAGRK